MAPGADVEPKDCSALLLLFAEVFLLETLAGVKVADSRGGDNNVDGVCAGT